MTAYHVIEHNLDPMVRYSNQWHAVEWEHVVTDKTNDIAVLKPIDTMLYPDPIPVLYGEADGQIYGQFGYALGFPQMLGDNTGQVTESNGRPMPIPALAVSTFSAGDDLIAGAGYVNAGFSGGAVVFEVGNRWTVSGMILGYPNIRRPILRKKGNQYEEVPDLYYEDHTGLVAYQRWSLIEHLIEVAAR